MEKTGFYCPKCKSVPIIQIIPKISSINIFCCCKCNKKLINYNNFLKNYYLKNINYENISNEPIYEKSLNEKDINQNKKEIDIEKIKENLYRIHKLINSYILEIKNNILKILENKIKEIKDNYENNIQVNLKLKNIIEILLNNYKSNNKNYSNIKNLIHNAKFNLGYLNNTYNKLKFDNNIPLGNLLQNINEFFNKTYILCNSNELLYTYKKFFNHSSSVTCLIELNKERIASCSNDSYINIYNLETKKSLYKYLAHNNGVNWIDKFYKNNIISCGNDSLLKIWLKPQLDYKDINPEGIHNITYSKTLEIKPLKSLNIPDNIFKFIMINDNSILLSGKNKVYLVRYKLIIDVQNEKNLLNVELFIVNTKSLDDNNMIDLLKVKNNKNVEFIFLLGSKKLSFLSLPDLQIVSEIKEFNNNSCFTCLTQLNKDEIIYSNGPIIKIFNINICQITYQYKNPNNITFLSKLKDNTLLISTKEGILRIELKSFEQISFIDTIVSSNYNSYYFQNYEKEKITYIYEFEDGKLGICSSYGNIKICRFLLA